jgi:hypothetical protein
LLCIQQYYSFAQEITENADKKAELIFGQIRGLALSTTSHSLESNQSLPFVTLPHFGVQAQQAGISTGSELIMFAPIVNEEDSQVWEQYAIDNQDWMAQDSVSISQSKWNALILFPFSTHQSLSLSLFLFLSLTHTHRLSTFSWQPPPGISQLEQRYCPTRHWQP